MASEDLCFLSFITREMHGDIVFSFYVIPSIRIKFYCEASLGISFAFEIESRIFTPYFNILIHWFLRVAVLFLFFFLLWKFEWQERMHLCIILRCQHTCPISCCRCWMRSCCSCLYWFPNFRHSSSNHPRRCIQGSHNGNLMLLQQQDSFEKGPRSRWLRAKWDVCWLWTACSDEAWR